MHHQGIGTGGLGRNGQIAGFLHAAAHAAEQRHAAVDLLRRRLDHGFAFAVAQAVVLAGIAVRDQHMHAGADRLVNDGRQALGRDLVLAVEGRDQNAGDAVQGSADLGRCETGHGDS
ncbi:hypothetical protein D3C78_1481230 [compost metagenome]